MKSITKTARYQLSSHHEWAIVAVFSKDRKFHASKCPPDVVLRKSFTSPSTMLVVAGNKVRYIPWIQMGAWACVFASYVHFIEGYHKCLCIFGLKYRTYFVRKPHIPRLLTTAQQLVVWEWGRQSRAWVWGYQLQFTPKTHHKCCTADTEHETSLHWTCRERDGWFFYTSNISLKSETWWVPEQAMQSSVHC